MPAIKLAFGGSTSNKRDSVLLETQSCLETKSFFEI